MKLPPLSALGSTSNDRQNVHLPPSLPLHMHSKAVPHGQTHFSGGCDLSALSSGILGERERVISGPMAPSVARASRLRTISASNIITGGSKPSASLSGAAAAHAASKRIRARSADHVMDAIMEEFADVSTPKTPVLSSSILPLDRSRRVRTSSASSCSSISSILSNFSTASTALESESVSSGRSRLQSDLSITDELDEVLGFYGPGQRKKRCKVPNCNKCVVQGGVCISHGAKVKRCSVDGCEKGAVNGGVCIAHGAKVKRCKVDGCDKQVQQGGLCISHGAKRKRCRVEGCEKYAQKGGACISHGGEKKLCKEPDCSKRAVKDGVCVAHGAKVKRCSVEGCERRSVKGGVCVSHGAKVNRCNYPSCEEYAKKGKGLCQQHGALSDSGKCADPNCKKFAKIGSFCLAHARGRLDSSSSYGASRSVKSRTSSGTVSSHEEGCEEYEEDDEQWSEEAAQAPHEMELKSTSYFHHQ